MPRAVIPARLQQVQQFQRAAVAQREVVSAAKLAREQIATVSGEIPADLQATITDFNNRISDLEAP